MATAAFDTNILIYALGADRRTERARQVLIGVAASGAIVPLQVFGEFANVCRRKSLLSAADVRARITAWAPSFVTPTTSLLALAAAATLADRYELQFFDALILEVARTTGATVLLSEDMQDGLDANGCRVVNPFSESNRAEVDALLTPSS